VPELLRNKEVSVAVLAPMRAASHAGKEFLKKFSEEFPKGARKALESPFSAPRRFGLLGRR